jgi:hypothetical protein
MLLASIFIKDGILLADVWFGSKIRKMFQVNFPIAHFYWLDVGVFRFHLIAHHTLNFPPIAPEGDSRQLK